MDRKKRWLAGLGMMVLVVALTLGAAACGGGDNGADEAAASGQEAQHVEDGEASHEDDEAVAADEAAHEEGDDHEAVAVDEATHEEGEDPEAGAHDPEAHAYLEAAPKDALYLVEMTNFAFTPASLEVNAGDVLEIAVQNIEPVLHDFTIDRIDADVHVSYLGGTGEHAHAEAAAVEADVHFALTEPGTGVVHLNIHEPGEYTIYCTVPGHREAGMEGTLIVR